MTKKLFLMGCVFSALFGCATNKEQRLYEVRMMSGESLYAKNEPQVSEDGYYHFKDVNNQSYIIRENLILFIEPESFKK